MTDLEAAWLAGFLEGEGSFMITRGRRSHCAGPIHEAAICATNTSRELVERRKALCGGKIITTRPKSDKWKPAHIWQLRGLAVGPVAKAVLPFLISKRRQAELIIELRSITRLGSPQGRNSTRKTEGEQRARENLYIEAKRLNKRGPSEEVLPVPERAVKEDPPLPLFGQAS